MFEQMSCNKLLRKANISGSLKKVEGGTGSVINNGMGPKVRWEEEHNASEKSCMQQAVHDACHMG